MKHLGKFFCCGLVYEVFLRVAKTRDFPWTWWLHWLRPSGSLQRHKVHAGCWKGSDSRWRRKHSFKWTETHGVHKDVTAPEKLGRQGGRRNFGLICESVVTFTGGFGLAATTVVECTHPIPLRIGDLRSGNLELRMRDLKEKIQNVRSGSVGGLAQVSLIWAETQNPHLKHPSAFKNMIRPAKQNLT